MGLDGGLNTYGYVGGNTLHLGDPTGEAVGGAAVGGYSVGTLAYPYVEPVITKTVDYCLSDRHKKNCEALYKSIMATCASLKGDKRRKCEIAARISYQQCLEQD